MMKFMADYAQKKGPNMLTMLYTRLVIRGSEKKIKWLRCLGARIGNGCKIKSSVNSFQEPYMMRIGDNVYIAAGCSFLTHDGAFSWMTRKMGVREERTDKLGLITIGNNCFIGAGSTILPNVKIGNNCIVAAAAVVTKGVPDNSVVGGNPAKIICTVENYLERNEGLSDYTCGWSAYKKRKYYEDKYSDSKE